MNLQEAFDAGFDAVKSYVDSAIAGFEARLAAVESRNPVPGPKGEPGEPGPAGADGRDGIDGKDGTTVTLDEIAPLIAEHVAKAVSEIPAPKDGADGRDGKDGKDGIDGKDGAPGERGEKGETGESGPAGERGERGDPGEPGEKGDPGPMGQKGDPGDIGPAGERGEKGDPGRDGIGLADAIIDRDGNLVLTMTDGRAKTLGCVVGKDGAQGLNGKDGRDGFGFDDLVFDFDGERTLIAKYSRADDVREFRFTIPAMIYRGVYKDGTEYQRGDMVTWAGSCWHCEADTQSKPGDGSSEWRLAVKSGRNGKDAIKAK